MRLFIAVAAWTGVTLGIGRILLVPHNRLPARGNAPLPMKSLQGPILQLELARNEADIRQILQPPGAAEAAVRRIVADARAGNRADSLFFIPSYTVLLGLIGALVLRGHRTAGMPAAVIVAAATALVAGCDYAENAGIERTLRHIEENGAPAPGDAAAIAGPGRTKWIALACLLLADGVLGATAGDRRVRVFSILPGAAGAFIAWQMARYFSE